MVCGNCATFFESKRCGNDTELEGKARNCKAGGRVVPASTACGVFVLYDTFFCNRYGQRYDVKICIGRQDRKYENCSEKCKQGRTLKNYIDWKGAM